MPGKIYLIDEKKQLQPMAEQSYEAERILQELLARYPDLLAGDQMDEQSPRRWLLVTREMKVPGDDNAAGRWSVDHLFLDQDGIPTLVEVKRSTDTRIRREVVGQMLDYAANAVAYWPLEKIQAAFERTCQDRGKGPEDVLSAFLEADLAPADADLHTQEHAREEDGDVAAAEAFWETVGTNLEAGKIRMVFVADQIPKELQRIIEFLNGQMNRAEVLGVEIKQFAGEGVTTMVPRVVGQAAGKDPSRRLRLWTDELFLRGVTDKGGPARAAVAKEIIDWMRSRDARVTYGRTKKLSSARLQVLNRGRWLPIIRLTADGMIHIRFGALAEERCFSDQSLMKGLTDRLAQMPGFTFSPEATDRTQSCEYGQFADRGAMTKFKDACEWLLLTLAEDVRPQ